MKARQRRTSGGKFCAQLQGAFSDLREAPEHLPSLAAETRRPPLRFPLKEVARISIDHPLNVKLDA